MKSVKVWATLTIVSGLLCGVGLLLAMLALQDIHRSTEASLAMEWTMVRISTGLTFVFIVVALVTVMKVFRWFEGMEK